MLRKTLILVYHMTTQCTAVHGEVDDGVMVEAINTYGSVLTVQVVCAGVGESGCQKAGERWLGVLGTLAGEHLDSVDRKAVHLPSSNHDLVLKFNTTSQAENINI